VGKYIMLLASHQQGVSCPWRQAGQRFHGAASQSQQRAAYIVYVGAAACIFSVTRQISSEQMLVL
jgi:hypothetical protein